MAVINEGSGKPKPKPLPLDPWAKQEVKRVVAARPAFGTDDALATRLARQRTAEAQAKERARVLAIGNESAGRTFFKAEDANRQKLAVEGMIQKAADAVAKKMGEELAVKKEQAGLDTIRNAAVYLSDAPMPVKRAEDGFRAPELSTLLMTHPDTGKPLLDPVNPKHVLYLQQYMGKQGVHVKKDGIFGTETYGGLVEVARLETEKQLKQETQFIQRELIDKGHLKGWKGATARQLAEAAFDPAAPFAVKSAYVRAYQNWLNTDQGGLPTLQDFRDQYMRVRLGVPMMLPVGSLRYLVDLPTSLEGELGSLSVDQVLAEFQRQERVQALQEVRAVASQDLGFWGLLTSGPKAVLDWMIKPAQEIAGSVFTAGTVLKTDPGYWLGKSQFGGDYWDKMFDKKYDWKQFDSEHPYISMVLQAGVDPLTYFSPWSSTKSLLTSGGRMAERMLVEATPRETARLLALRTAGRVGNAMPAHPFMSMAGAITPGMLDHFAIAMGSSITSSFATDSVYRFTGIRAFAEMRVDDMLDRIYHEGRTLNRLGYGVYARGREATGNMVDRALGRGIADEPVAPLLVETPVRDLGLPPDTPIGPEVIKVGIYYRDPDGTDAGYAGRLLQDLWDHIGPKNAEPLQKRLLETEQSILAIMGRRVRRLTAVVDRHESVLFTETGAHTRLGGRVSALVHRQAWLDARDAMIARGEATLDDFGAGNFVPPRADLVEKFKRDYLMPRYEYTEDIILPALHSHALSQGYGYPVGAEAQDVGGRMLLDAMRTDVQVRNPNQRWSVDWTPGRKRLIEKQAKARVRDAQDLKAAQDRMKQLVAEDLAAANGVRTGGTQAARDAEKARLAKRIQGLRDTLNNTPVLGDASEEVFAVRDLVRLSEVDLEDASMRVGSIVERLAKNQDVMDGARVYMTQGSSREEAVLRTFREKLDARVRELLAETPPRKDAVGVALEELVAPGAPMTKGKVELIGDVIKDVERQQEYWEDRLVLLQSTPSFGTRMGELETEIEGRLKLLEKRLKWLQKSLGGSGEFKVESIKWAQDDLRSAREMLSRRKAAAKFVESELEHTAMGARGFSAAAMRASVEEEAGRWTAHVASEEETRRALGLSGDIVAPMGRDKDTITANVYGNWSYDPQMDLWMDTREYVTQPALYSHDLTPEQLFGNATMVTPDGEVMPAYEYLGVGLTPDSTRELASFFDGYYVNPRGSATAGKRSLLPDRTVEAERDIMGPAYVSSSLSSARSIESSVHPRRVGMRADDVEEFGAALADRKAVVGEMQDHAKLMMYKRYGLFMHALNHSQYRSLRWAYKSFRSATSLWRFSTLPLRFGWVVRNVADNVLRVIVAGVRDPRVFLNQRGKTIFEHADIPNLRRIVGIFDRVAGTNALEHLDAGLAHFARIGNKDLAKLLGMTDIYIPQELLGGSFSTFVKAGEAGKKEGPLHKSYDWIWSMMGEKPENYFRKALYRDSFIKARALGKTDLEASRIGMKRVEQHLFDYSNPTLLDYNLKLITPFIVFWRQNLPYWGRVAMEKPWVFNRLGMWDEANDTAHSDRPEWMRRYITTDGWADPVASVPGVGKWLSQAFAEGSFDPLNMFSVTFLYRFYKDQNPMLTQSGEQGLAFISEFIDNMDRSGLGLNPFLRKPMEAALLANPQLWRHAFPFSDPVLALTRDWWPEQFPNGLDLEAPVADFTQELFGREETLTDFGIRKFEEAVEMELARQRELGGQPDLAAAQEKIRGVMAAQAVVGYFGGLYARQMDEADVALYGALEDEIQSNGATRDLAYQNHPGYAIFKEYFQNRKKESPADLATFAKWAEVKSAVDAYWNVPFQQRDEWLMDFPELAPYVLEAWNTTEPVTKTVQSLRIQRESSRLMGLLDQLYDNTQQTLSFDDRQYLRDTVTTPELEAYWAKNRTGSKVVEAFAKAAMTEHYDKLSKSYFAIPAKDLKAREAFLSANPLLSWYWNKSKGSKPGELAHSLTLSANAGLRQVFFAMNDAGNTAAAHDFMLAHPFIFEFTATQDNVTIDGEWVPIRMRTDARFREDYTDWMIHHPFEAAQASFWSSWYGEKDEAKRRRMVVDFGLHYGFNPYTQSYGARLDKETLEAIRSRSVTSSRHSRDYLLVRPFLERYFSFTDPRQRERYLADHPALQTYFDRWSGVKLRSRGGQMSEHAKAYLAIKGLLDGYFALTDEAQKIFYLELHPEVGEYFRRWSAAGTVDSGLYRLLEEYYKLPKFSQARTQFLQNEPLLKQYFADMSHPETKAIMTLVEVYFDLERPADKRKFLALHPEVKAWFDERRRVKGEVAKLRKDYDMTHNMLLRDIYQQYAEKYLPEAELVRAMLRGATPEVTLSRRENRTRNRPRTGTLVADA